MTAEPARSVFVYQSREDLMQFRKGCPILPLPGLFPLVGNTAPREQSFPCPLKIRVSAVKHESSCKDRQDPAESFKLHEHVEGEPSEVGIVPLSGGGIDRRIGIWKGNKLLAKIRREPTAAIVPVRPERHFERSRSHRANKFPSNRRT